MNNTNCAIEVTAWTFRSGPATTQKLDKPTLESYPRRMVYQGREYTFVETGMHYLIKKGQAFIKLFDVSDGDRQYRLRLEDDTWTLVAVKGVQIGGYYA